MPRVPGPLASAVVAEVTRLLQDRSMSVRELARASGLPQATLARKMRGEGLLDLGDVEAIARALDVEVRDLIGWAQA